MRGQRTGIALFIGIVFATVDPPAQSAMTVADNEMEKVVERRNRVVNDYNVAVSQRDRDALKPLVEQMTNEAQAAIEFQNSILSHLVDIQMDNNNNNNDNDVAVNTMSRLNLGSHSVLAAADQTSVATQLNELPLSAILHAVLFEPNVLLATNSERRFFSRITDDFNRFMDLYRSVAETGNVLSDNDRKNFERTGIPLVVIGAQPVNSQFTPSTMPSGGNIFAFNQQNQAQQRRRRFEEALHNYNVVMATAVDVDVDENGRTISLRKEIAKLRARTDKEPLNDETKQIIEQYARRLNQHVAKRVAAKRELDEARADIRAQVANLQAPLVMLNEPNIRNESMRVADAQIAAMTANDVRSSTAWQNSSKKRTSIDSHSMFFDKQGQLHLAERIAAAATRSNIETRAQRIINESYTDERDAADQELILNRSLGKPLGVEYQLWLQLKDMAQRNGVSNASNVANAIQRAGGLERAYEVVDWRGVHSEFTAQPDPCIVEFSNDNKRATLLRGSERLMAGYNFESLTQRLQQLIAKYNRGPETPELKTSIVQTALHFNVLAQFAPKLIARAVLSADDIESALKEMVGPKKRAKIV